MRRKLTFKLVLLSATIFGSWLVTGCSIESKNTPPAPTTTTPTTLPTASLLPTQIPSSTSKPSSTPIPTPTATPTPTTVDPRANLGPGLYLVYWSQKALYLHSMNQSLNVRWVSVGDNPNVSLSPNGQKLAFSDQGNIYTYDLTTGTKTLFPAVTDNAYSPKWSPDGDRLVFSFDNNPPVDSSIYIASLLDNRITRVTTWSTIERNPAWSPDGRWIAFASDQAKINNPVGSFLGVTELYLMDTDCLATLSNCSDQIKQITDMGVNGDSDNPAWSPDSRHIVFTCGGLIGDKYQKDVCVVDIDGSHLRHLTNTVEDELWPAWSPDGNYIAFTRKDASTRAGDIFIMSASGESPINITNSPDENEIFSFWLVVN